MAKKYINILSNYETADNYLHQEVRVFDDEEKARHDFMSQRDSIKSDVYGESDTDDDEDENDDYCGYYEASREVGTEFEYQAKLRMLEVEVEGPHIWLFDRERYTEDEAKKMSKKEAEALSELPKDERTVWRYCWGSSSFQQDFNAGCMDSKKYIIRFM